MTFKGIVKGLLALVIILAGAAIGWAVATQTNPYAPNNTNTAVAANATSVPSTPVPTFTAGSAASTTPGAGAAASGQANGTPGAGGQGQGGQRSRPVTGTVESYEATSKILTVKTADGKSQKFGLSNARFTKSEKVSADDFGKLASNGIVIVTGNKNADGSYNARSLTAVDTSGLAAPGGGAGAGGGFPGGGGGFGGGGGQAPVIVQGGKLDGTTFSGSSFNGDAIKATISDQTNLLKQGQATTDDLKAGTNVSVTAPTAQGDTPAEAQLVTVS